MSEERQLTDQEHIELAALAKVAMKTPHQQRVEAFMALARQDLPDAPCVPSPEVRLLRAKLIFEEAMETINDLGVQISFELPEDILDRRSYDAHIEINFPEVEDPKLRTAPHSYVVTSPGNLEGVADGCADISVVTIGTLSAFGISDIALLEMVDGANLNKFQPGHTIREDGKLIKPPDWTAPDILGLLKAQGYKPENDHSS